MTAPDDTRAQAGECNVAAIGARAAAATPGPWRSRWEDELPSLPASDDATDQQVIVSDAPELAGLDGIPGLHRCVVGAFWYDGLNASCRREDAAFIAHARTDVPALLRHIAAEPARVADAVAGETARAIAACEHVASQCREGDERDLALTCAEAIAVDAPAQGGG